MLRKILAAVALLASTSAHADWQRASSRHFVVLSDDRPDSVRAFATRLERFDSAVRAALKLPDPEVSPSSRVQVFVLPGVADVQRLARINGSVAGYYQDDYPSDIFAFVPRRSGGDDGDAALSPQQVLLHEYVHHLMYSSFQGVVVPSWFSEGFAELFATAKFGTDGSVTFGQVPVYRAYGIDMANLVPVSRLVRQGPNYRNPMEAQVFYGRSWLLTHYLMFDHERARTLAAYIVALNSGKSVDEAASILGANSALDLRLDSYARQTRWPASTIAANQLNVGEVTVAPLSRGEAAMMPATIRSRAGVDSRQAQEVVAEARRLAALYPQDPAVQNELAEAEYDAGNYAASEAAADRALAAVPQSVHALIYKGMAQIARLKAAHSTDTAAWTTARRFYLAANRAEPRYSYPPQLYFESFAEEGIRRTPAAQSGLLYAYTLRPELQSLRFETARSLLESGRADAAKVVIEPLAYSPHGGPVAELSRTILDSLNQGNTAAALQAIEKAEQDAKKKEHTT